jgi:glutathione S-transferase
MRLYEYSKSGNSHKVRLLLSFLGLPYESVEIALMAGEQHQEAFLALNPRGEVPVLEDEGTVLGSVKLAPNFYWQKILGREQCKQPDK